jgi:hypothetical protein
MPKDNCLFHYGGQKYLQSIDGNMYILKIVIALNFVIRAHVDKRNLFNTPKLDICHILFRYWVVTNNISIFITINIYNVVLFKLPLGDYRKIYHFLRKKLW